MNKKGLLHDYIKILEEIRKARVEYKEYGVESDVCIIFEQNDIYEKSSILTDILYRQGFIIKDINDDNGIPLELIVDVKNVGFEDVGDMYKKRMEYVLRNNQHMPNARNLFNEKYVSVIEIFRKYKKDVYEEIEKTKKKEGNIICYTTPFVYCSYSGPYENLKIEDLDKVWKRIVENLIENGYKVEFDNDNMFLELRIRM